MRHIATDHATQAARRAARWGTAALLAASFVAACGSDDDAATTSSVAVDLGVGSLPSGGGTPTIPPGSTQPTLADDSASVVTAGPVQIDVVVGRDSGADRIESIALGSDVTVNITNPDAADEFHLHGIDLERAVEAGVMATFNFSADTAGTYEIESHATGEVLVVLVVE